MKFIEARWHGSGGNDHPTRVVIHDAEYPEKLDAAVAVAHYFQHVDRKASAHYVCDDRETVQCVKGGDVAYHAPPNKNSIGIELVGYAKQTTADWLDAYGVAMLRDQAAPLVRDLCATLGIPRMWLSVADLKAGRSGITSHNNVSLAFGQSTHTDPGGNFPIDQFMAYVLEGDDMPLSDADLEKIRGLFTVDSHDSIIDNYNRLKNLEAVAHRDLDVLEPEIAEVLAAVKDNPHSGTGAGDIDPDEAAKAVADLLAQRLES